MNKYFSEFDIHIMNKIVDIRNKSQLNILANIVDDFFDLSGKYFLSFTTENICEMKIEQYFFNELSSKYGVQGLHIFIQEIEEYLFKLVLIINYLLENKFVIQKEINNNFDLGSDNSSSGSTYILYQNFSSDLKQALYNLSNKVFIPTNSLLILHKNKFKTESDLKFESDIKNTRLSMIFNSVTILISIAAIIITIISSNQDSVVTIKSGDLTTDIRNETLDKFLNKIINIEKIDGNKMMIEIKVDKSFENTLDDLKIKIKKIEENTK